MQKYRTENNMIMQEHIKRSVKKRQELNLKTDCLAQNVNIFEKISSYFDILCK